MQKKLKTIIKMKKYKKKHKIIKEISKFFSPENIYVQLFKIKASNNKSEGNPNIYLTIQFPTIIPQKYSSCHTL